MVVNVVILNQLKHSVVHCYQVQIQNLFQMITVVRFLHLADGIIHFCAILVVVDFIANMELSCRSHSAHNVCISIVSPQNILQSTMIHVHVHLMLFNMTASGNNINHACHTVTLF